MTTIKVMIGEAYSMNLMSKRATIFLNTKLDPLVHAPQTRGPQEGPMRPANIFSNKERVIFDVILEEISTI